MAAFQNATRAGPGARAGRLAAHPDDHVSLFLLAKLDVNQVWLQLGTLGHKTGWGEYREARRALDEVLERHPEDVRARVRAGVDRLRR